MRLPALKIDVARSRSRFVRSCAWTVRPILKSFQHPAKARRNTQFGEGKKWHSSWFAYTKKLDDVQIISQKKNTSRRNNHSAKPSKRLNFLLFSRKIVMNFLRELLIYPPLACRAACGIIRDEKLVETLGGWCLERNIAFKNISRLLIKDNEQARVHSSLKYVPLLSGKLWKHPYRIRSRIFEKFEKVNWFGMLSMVPLASFQRW